MPYITSELRNAYDQWIEDLINGIDTSGELNYVITKLCHELILKQGCCYKVLNNVIGTLECAKLELYKTIIAPYEDLKREEHGPISELDQ